MSDETKGAQRPVEFDLETALRDASQGARDAAMALSSDHERLMAGIHGAMREFKAAGFTNGQVMHAALAILTNQLVTANVDSEEHRNKLCAGFGELLRVMLDVVRAAQATPAGEA